MPHIQDVAIVGDHAVLGGYAAWFLHRVLRDYPGGLERLLARSGLPPDQRANVLRAARALGEVGATWRMTHDLAASGSGTLDVGETTGDLRSKHGPADPLRSEDAASVLGISSRRVRVLAESGQLRGRRDSGGRWQFEPIDVEAELERRRAISEETGNIAAA